jgi:hypothetical protein
MDAIRKTKRLKLKLTQWLTHGTLDDPEWFLGKAGDGMNV